jgi:hypothetical protein
MYFGNSFDLRKVAGKTRFTLAIFTFLCYIFSGRGLASAGGIVPRGAAQGTSRFCGRRTEGGRRHYEKMHKDTDSGGGRSRACDRSAQHQIGQEDKKPADIGRGKGVGAAAGALLLCLKP